MSELASVKEMEDFDLKVVQDQQPLNSMAKDKRKKFKKLLHSIGFEKKDMKNMRVTRLIPHITD